jgi:hypothetical protein
MKIMINWTVEGPTCVLPRKNRIRVIGLLIDAVKPQSIKAFAESEVQASKAYDAAAKNYFGKFALTNH